MCENYPTLCISCFIFCISFYILTPEKGMKVSMSEVSAKEVQTATGKTATGVSLWLSDEWRDNQEEKKWYENSSWKNGEIWWKVECGAECKIDTLKKLGIRDEIAESLVTNCKALADDPRKCVIIWASIVKNESWWGYKCKTSNKYNCFGLSVKDKYNSYNDGVLHFIEKWNKFWFKAKDMSHFYSPAWKLPPTRFCTSEDSTGTSIGCPAWLRNSTIIFKKLDSAF